MDDRPLLPLVAADSDDEIESFSPALSPTELESPVSVNPPLEVWSQPTQVIQTSTFGLPSDLPRSPLAHLSEEALQAHVRRGLYLRGVFEVVFLRWFFTDREEHLLSCTCICLRGARAGYLRQ